jgi:hypothetical protein
MNIAVVVLALVVLLPTATTSLSLERQHGPFLSRRSWLQAAPVVATTTAILTVVGGASPATDMFGAKVMAAETSTTGKLDLSDDELQAIVTSDVTDRQFLVTANLTRFIYQPTATFTDETNTFGMEQWIAGTRKLFVGDKSHVRLIGDVKVTPQAVEFRFDEDLMFNIPFRPVVFLSGKVVLTRDESSGFVTAYREYWDQDIATVLKSVKF